MKRRGVQRRAKDGGALPITGTTPNRTDDGLLPPRVSTPPVAERRAPAAPIPNEEYVRGKLRRRLRDALRDRVVMRVLRDPDTARDPRPISVVIERTLAREVEREVTREILRRRTLRLERGVGPVCPAAYVDARHAHRCARKTAHHGAHRCRSCGLRFTTEECEAKK